MINICIYNTTISRYHDITISNSEGRRAWYHDGDIVFSCFGIWMVKKARAYWARSNSHARAHRVGIKFSAGKPGKRRTWYHDITLCLFATTLLSFSRPKCVDIAIISGPQVITNPPTNIVYLLVNCQSVAPYRICHLPIPRRTFPNRGKGIIYILWHTVTFPRHYI